MGRRREKLPRKLAGLREWAGWTRYGAMQFHTLISSSLCALVALGTTAWAEHGSTKAFEERFKKLRKEVEGKVRNQRLDPHWTEDEVFYKREGCLLYTSDAADE